MVYKIIEYNVIDKTDVVYQRHGNGAVSTKNTYKSLYSFEEMPLLEFKEQGGGRSPEVVYKGTNEIAKIYHGYFTEKKPDGAIPHTEKFMPYFADVTEDLPSSVRGLHKRMGLIPKTYKNCQLLTQKHGGYLQFYHEPTNETLRIALNSNDYSLPK